MAHAQGQLVPTLRPAPRFFIQKR
ncbi:hypothetical protein KIPB_016281, partial [Kipferlia bialata]|eukprot:g16281.t1